MSTRPVVLALVAAGLAGGAAVPWLLARERAWLAEAAALRGQAAPAQATLDSLVGLTDSVRRRLVTARVRAASRGEPSLHLELQRDSGVLVLLRDGIELRRMRAVLLGEAPSPGVRTLATLVEQLPDSSPVVDTLGRSIRDSARAPRTVDRVRLDDGTELVPTDATALLLPSAATGDTLAVAPPRRAITLAARDLRAIRPNLVTGMKVYTW